MPDLVLHPITWLIASGMIFSVLAKKLSLFASITGGILAFLIFFGLGATGVVLLTAFFILASAATSWRYHEKKKMALHEAGDGVRSSIQVMANAGAATISAILSMTFPEYKYLFLLIAAGSFSAATADTVSSELGNLYGKRFYNILNFRDDIKGLDGVVSLEGTLAGIAGSTLIALVYSFFQGFGNDFFWIIIAGTFGNISDSVLGASLERKKVLGNDAVNFCNTVIGGLTALAFMLI